MPRPLYIGTHAALAGAFFFVFQRYALGATMSEASLWGAVAAAGAAILAYQQTKT